MLNEFNCHYSLIKVCLKTSFEFSTVICIAPQIAKQCFNTFTYIDFE